MKYYALTLAGLLLSATAFADDLPSGHETFVCTKKVAGNSKFSCITPEQAMRFIGLGCNIGYSYIVRLTNIGIHSFKLHPHGDEIKPGEATDSLYVTIGYKRRAFPLPDKYDDGAVNLYRSDSFSSGRTLTARVDVYYYTPADHCGG